LTASLRGTRIVVSAGPTYEDIDPVRFIGNRSSGRMGFAIADAAAQRGAQVVLVAGPVHLDTPAGVTRIDVRSAAQMQAAVLAALPADIYIGAAAVADFAPAQVAPRKLKKSDDGDGLVLELVRTPDILASVAGHASRPRLVVGFAAETHDVAHYARDKLARKQLDLIAANLLGVAGSGFESESNALTVYGAAFDRALGPAPKTRLAGELLDLIAARLPRTQRDDVRVDGTLPVRTPPDRAP
jgi:phosphopantothenoylcysteine decarboxylase/phosphopantothenate--cysteine ligase